MSRELSVQVFFGKDIENSRLHDYVQLWMSRLTKWVMVVLAETPARSPA